MAHTAYCPHTTTPVFSDRYRLLCPSRVIACPPSEEVVMTCILFSPSPRSAAALRRVVAFIAALCCLFCLPCISPTTTAQTLLVDFGNDAGGNSFGLSGWDSAISSATLHYTADGPGGLVADASADEYSDFQGVRGSTRSFITAERVVVTWYNRSDEVIRFTSRISFTDSDQPDGGSSDGRWYTMRGFDNSRDTWTEVGPQETAQTMFAVRGSGLHKTDSAYALVNVNLAIEWGSSDYKQYLVCDRIDLYDDADITPPAAPTGVQATDISDSKIRITWEEPDDNVGVYDYLIYLNGEVEGYSRENNYTCVFLEPATDYKLAVTALDMMRNESARSWEMTVRTAPF